MKHRRAFQVFVVVGVLSAPAPAHADSFEVTSLGASDIFQIKPFMTFESSSSETIFEGPALDVSAPLLPRVELSTKFGAGHVDEAGAPARWGLIDTELAIKWEIVPVPDAGGFGVTTEGAIVAPTGTNGLGGDEWHAKLPVVVGWVSGAWELRGQVGYGRGLKSGEDEVVLGAVATYSLSDSVAVGAEIAGASTLGLAGYEPSANVGIMWELAPAIELQARLGRSIRTGDHVATTSGLLAIEFGL